MLGLISHSDRGSQYRRALEGNGMVCSTSRKGDCWDNPVAETFCGTIKDEPTDDENFESRDDARRAVFEHVWSAFQNLGSRRFQHVSAQAR